MLRLAAQLLAHLDPVQHRHHHSRQTSPVVLRDGKECRPSIDRLDNFVTLIRQKLAEKRQVPVRRRRRDQRALAAHRADPYAAAKVVKSIACSGNRRTPPRAPAPIAEHARAVNATTRSRVRRPARTNLPTPANRPCRGAEIHQHQVRAAPSHCYASVAVSAVSTSCLRAERIGAMPDSQGVSTSRWVPLLPTIALGAPGASARVAPADRLAQCPSAPSGTSAGQRRRHDHRDLAITGSALSSWRVATSRSA